MTPPQMQTPATKDVMIGFKGSTHVFTWIHLVALNTPEN